jgi:nucleoside-diphosphate-sugar epimerase
MNDRIRSEGTRCLAAAAGRVGAGAYLQQGIVWSVRAPEGVTFDEDASPVNDPIIASSLYGERIAREAGLAHGFRVAILRCGGFYSADGWHTRILADSLARGRPILVDGGRAVWSFLHSEDAASACVAAAEWPKPGVWHIVDDRPVSLSEFLGELARRLGTRRPRRLPRSLARLFLGRYTADLLATSFPTSNRRFRGDFRWTPTYPTFVEGFDEIVAAWKAEGFPRRGVAP